MKKAVVALALVAMGFGVVADNAEARRRGGGRDRVIVEQAPTTGVGGIDLTTLMLLGAMGGGGGVSGISSILPFLALGGTQQASETIIIEDRGGRRRSRRRESLR